MWGRVQLVGHSQAEEMYPSSNLVLNEMCHAFLLCTSTMLCCCFHKVLLGYGVNRWYQEHVVSLVVNRATTTPPTPTCRAYPPLPRCGPPLPSFVSTPLACCGLLLNASQCVPAGSPPAAPLLLLYIPVVISSGFPANVSPCILSVPRRAVTAQLRCMQCTLQVVATQLLIFPRRGSPIRVSIRRIGTKHL
jgi:hypothetical protein